jgi:hypothetical protein
MPPHASAQSLTSQLGQLVTEQRASQVYVPDPPAAVATSDAITKLFQIELSRLPTPSSSAGVIYRLDPSLGVVARASEGFGPFFTERALRNTKGRFSAGVAFQVARFSFLSGDDLTAGTFPISATRLSDVDPPLAVENLTLHLERQSATVFADYGVGERLALGAVLPLARVQVSGSRIRTQNAGTALQSVQAGSATGFGDLTVNARMRIGGDGIRGASVGGDLLLPTGRAEDFLGAGRLGARVLGVGSWEQGPVGINVNGGFSVGGLSKAIDWSGALTLAANPSLTLVGEILGRRSLDARALEPVWQRHSSARALDTLRWVTSDRGVIATSLAAGARWNVAGPWLVNGNVLINLSSGGLRSRLTPAISLDYDFGL